MPRKSKAKIAEPESTLVLKGDSIIKWQGVQEFMKLVSKSTILSANECYVLSTLSQCYKIELTSLK